MNVNKVAEDAVKEYQDTDTEDSGLQNIRKLRELYRQKNITKADLNTALAQLFATGIITRSQYISAKMV